MRTSGVFGGINGWEWRAFRRGWLALAAFVLALDALNVLSVLHDRAAAGRPLPVWEPLTWEYTSGIGIMLFSVIGFVALRLAPPVAGRWLRFVLVHALASLVFSILHVATMFALRWLVYSALGQHYDDGIASFPYEYRKDLLGYVVTVGVFWLFRRLAEPGAQPALAAAGAGRLTFDIRDGTRLLRVPVADIVSVASAGNYVEFALSDGRKPLMRATLSGLETQLAPHGLVRTHRSWLVNAGRVAGLEAEGSGDFTVELDTGQTAPLSRRFPQALERLRSAGGHVALSA